MDAGDMPLPGLAHVSDAWTLQAVTASRFLTHFYRLMADGHQLSAAIQAGAAAEERMVRLGLQKALPDYLESFRRMHPDETEAEEAAWCQIIEAMAGFRASIILLDAMRCAGMAPGLQGLRTTVQKALQAALRGYRTAFPEAMVVAGTLQAIRKAAEVCTESFAGDLADSAYMAWPKKRQRLVLETLEGEAGHALGWELVSEAPE